MRYLKKYSLAFEKRQWVPYVAEVRGLKSDCQNILATVTFDLVAEDK
jgi:hypothetical protein